MTPILQKKLLGLPQFQPVDDYLTWFLIAECLGAAHSNGHLALSTGEDINIAPQRISEIIDL